MQLMRGCGRFIAGVAAAGAAFLVLALVSSWLELLFQRELLRGAEWAGLMDAKGGLGGQILGLNYLRNPRWVHWVATALGAAVAYAPAVLIAMLVFPKVRHGRWRGARATRCGHCGTELRGLREAKCPACGRGF
ncbi:MAG: hypothetical protein H7Y88_13745 [Phycisphaerales bacterium]|nr:hypothetical protein [Phycisphaerales bacterium]